MSPALPERSTEDLIAALRVRAARLTGEPWEVPATILMLREAADRLETLQAQRVEARGRRRPWWRR